MQAKIYISSTFSDLDPYREKVYRALRKMQHDENVVTAVARWQMDAAPPVPDAPAPAATSKPAKAAVDAQARARSGYPQLWAPGSRLRMRFLNGSQALHQRVVRVARLWSAYANIDFELSEAKDAEIRVSFKEPGGNWSMMGTDSLQVAGDEATMNFGWIREDSPLIEIEQGVVHEVGHALGLYREHNMSLSGGDKEFISRLYPYRL